MGQLTKQEFLLVGLLQLLVLTYGDPPFDTPSRCANARKPTNGNVKCGCDTGSIFDDIAGASGGTSWPGDWSKGPDIYICTYSCNKGYQLHGKHVLQCPISSITDNPNCAPVECSTLPTIDHGSLNCSNSFLYGSTCQYTCAQGYSTSGGSNSLTCGSDGFWSGSVPTCEPVQCAPLEEPEHGSLSCSNGRLFGSDCRYICDDRYILNGSPVVTCSQNGTWSGETPKCELGECTPLPLLVHGSLSCTRGWDRRSVCFYSCHHGFSLTGGSCILRCGSNGFWRGDIPTCDKDTRAGTTLPPTIPTESNSTTDTTAGTTLQPTTPTETNSTTDARAGTTLPSTVPTEAISTTNTRACATFPPTVPTESNSTTNTTAGTTLPPTVQTESNSTTGNSSKGRFTTTNEMLNLNVVPPVPVRRDINGSGDDGGKSGLNGAAIFSILAAAIIVIAVGIGLFAAYRKTRGAQEEYDRLQASAQIF